ncbi:MAG: hypothetical protein Q8Q49_06740 [bacterium]|nr:hypothetical protein [bacterium]
MKGIRDEEVRLQRLEKRYKNTAYPVLSVYLGFAGKKTPSTQVVLSLFHSYIHRFLTDDEQKFFRRDIEKITTYLSETFDSRGKRSIVFITSGRHLWEVFSFEFYLPPMCVVGYAPYLHPIVGALTSYKKYLVLLVDRKRARLFLVHLGEIEEQKEFLDGHVPQNVRANERDFYGRSNKIFRHIEDHLHRHLQLVSEAVSSFIREYDGNFLLVGGHKEMVSKMKKHLPSSVQRMVLGEFVTAVNIPLKEVFLHSKKIAETIERDVSEQQLAASLRG